MRAQPIRGGKDTTRFEHPKHLGRQRLLVGNVDDGILGEHHVKALIRIGKRPRSDLVDGDLSRQPRRIRAGVRGGANRFFYIYPRHMRSAMVAHHQNRNSTGPTANIEHLRPRQINPVQHPRYFLRATGREKPLAPKLLKKADMALIVKNILRHAMPPD